MDLLQQMKKAKPTVLEVLKTITKARDNDTLLLVEVWKRQAKNEIVSYGEFKYQLLTEELSPPETITRTRRKLQEQNKELRGRLYLVRKKQEQVAKNQLRFDF